MTPGSVMLWALAALVVVVVAAGAYSTVAGLIRRERAARRSAAWDRAAQILAGVPRRPSRHTATEGSTP